MILAILRAQLLSLRGLGLKNSAGSLLSIIPSLAFYLLWVFFAMGPYLFCKYLTPDPTSLRYLASGLFGVFAYWQIAPVLTASMGASLDLQKLIVYPIDLNKLFFVEVLLRFLTVGEMLIMLAGGALGILSNPELGGIFALPRIMLALVPFIAFNLIVAAGVRSMIERLFRIKRFREVSMIVFVLLCASPGILIASKAPIGRVLPFLPLNTWWPWGAAARMLAARGSVFSGVLLPLAVLFAWGGAAWAFGRREFYRSLRSDPNAGRPLAQVRPASQLADRLFRLPGRIWSDPLGAMIEKELRSLSRCAGFRLTFVMGFTFGLLVFFPRAMGGNKPTSFMTEHFLAWVSIYSMLLVGFFTFWNSFGYDRSAVQFYFAAPVPFRRVIMAKNISAAISQAVELTLIIIVFLALPVRSRLFAIPEAIAVTATACLYLFALGNITSVRYPNPVDPDKMSRGSASRGKSALSMLILPVAILPIGLAYWGGHVFQSDLVFFALLGIAAIIGGVVYWIGMDTAVEVTLARREKMIASLSKGEGPLSIT